MMSTYCGLGTTANKVRWTVCALFSVFSIVAFFFMAKHINQCNADVQKIVHKFGPGRTHPNPCFDPAVDEVPPECPKYIRDCANVTFSLLGLIGMLIGATVPLYVMCCCSSPPQCEREATRKKFAPLTAAPAAPVASGEGVKVPLLQPSSEV